MKNIHIIVPDMTQAIAITIVYKDSKTLEQFIYYDVTANGDQRQILTDGERWFLPKELKNEVVDDDS